VQPATERKLQVIFDVHQYSLSEQEQKLLHDGLEGLARQVENFPVADLHVLVEGNARNNDVSVKLRLMLPGTTLVASDHDAVTAPAFERCVSSLAASLHAYKDRLGRVKERQKAEKGTHQDLQPSNDLDQAAVDAAVTGGDYSSFRAATFPFEEGVRKRVGRWVQRYPEFEARIGKGVEIDDVVEEVFLLAFEGYESRPADVRFGDWLEALLDPAVKALAENPDEELENVNLARAARAAEQGPETL
jgi:ribosome-associated translation inhibitor RaiA